MNFKIYSKQLNRWISDLYLSNLCYNLESLTINDLFNQLENNRNVIVQRGTGLKDKEGKEIFEGDIVYYNDDSDDDTGQVIWLKDETMFRVEWGHDTYTENAFRKDMEVIGNILENPELLK